MSFSKECAGRADSIRETVSRWPAEIRATDEGYGAAEGVIEGHQTQAAAIVLAIETVLERHPDQFLHVIGHGHANADGSGQCGVSYRFPDEQNKDV